MDEQRLIENILSGDTQSFSYLVTQYQGMAFNIALRILENREEAEEAVQDAFVKAYRALPDFHFGSKFSTWFYRIVYNTAITIRRKQFIYTAGYEEAESGQITTDEIDNASSLLEREDRKEIISRVLKKLPEDEALLLTFYYLDECSVEDIHQITGLTASNIKVKLFRARKHFYVTLKQMMKHEIHNIL